MLGATPMALGWPQPQPLAFTEEFADTSIGMTLLHWVEESRDMPDFYLWAA
jgi:hypothetical protein